MPDIVRRDPFAFPSFDQMHRVMDRLFDDSFFRGPLLERWDRSTLPLDVSEKDGKIIVRASLPGFTKEETHVELHDGVLSITAQHAEEKEEQGEQYYRRERHYGAVSRSVSLPGVITDANVDAELKDGVLTLTVDVPKEQLPKKVEIRGA